MSIKKIEMRPNDGSGAYGDILYPKTSADMVEGLSVVATTGDYNDLLNKNGLLLRRVTAYVTATENNQKTFTLTFPQGIDLLNTDIELRVNSTYIEDKLYDKVGFNTIVFKETELGYDIGKELAYSFFTTANVEESFTNSIIMDNLNLSITTTEEGQKNIPIPIPNYNEERFKFFMVIGGTVFSSRRYTIVGNDVVLNSGEEGFSLGRDIDFIVFFTKQIIGTLPSADGGQLVDGTVSLLKLETVVQNLLSSHSQKITSLEGEVEYIKNNGVGNIFVSRRTPIPYTATVDCVSFPVPEIADTNTVYLILDNVVPVLGQDYTVDIVNKVVNLNFTLNQGQKIYYTVEIKADAIVPMVSTSLTETVGGKVLDATLGKVLDDKIGLKVDKTQIKNSLTETVVGNVLDAVQGKALNDKLSILNDDRGYLTTKVYSSIDFNTLILNGKYRIGAGTNKPDASTDSTFLVEVTSMSVNYLYQKAICLYSNFGNTGKTYERTSSNGVFGAWREIATMDEVKPIIDSGVIIPYEVTDFNNIPSTKRYLKGGVGVTNAPNVGQFIGMQSAWDANFKFQIGADIYGALWGRHSGYGWKQLATMDTLNAETLTTYAQLDSLRTETRNYQFLGSGAGGFTDGALYSLEVVVAKANIYSATCLQRTTCVYSGNPNEVGTVRTRAYYNIATFWQPWRTYASMEKADLTLLNGWVNADGTLPINYAKAGNLCHVYGIVKGGTLTAGTVVCNGLPTTLKAYESKFGTYGGSNTLLSTTVSGVSLVTTASWNNVGTNFVYLDFTYNCV